MILVKYGDIIPLFVVAESGDSDLVIKADIVDPVAGTKLHENLVLSYIAGSSGMYKNSAITMPNIRNVVAVYKVFEADGVSKLGVEAIGLGVEEYGQALPLFVVSEDGATDLVIKANVVNPISGTILHENVALSHIAGSGGMYNNSSIEMPNLRNVHIVYSIFEADGLTRLGAGLDIISLSEDDEDDSGSAVIFVREAVTGYIEDDAIIGIVEDIV